MRISEAIELFQNHQRSMLRPRTIASYHHFLQRFETQFGELSFDSVGADDLCRFLETLTQNLSKSTRHLRYTQLKSFSNFCIEKREINIRNPCATPLLSKAFKRPKQVARRILDKEMVEEMIYNAKNPRDRLIVELQARCGLRIGEDDTTLLTSSHRNYRVLKSCLCRIDRNVKIFTAKRRESALIVKLQ